MLTLCLNFCVMTLWCFPNTNTCNTTNKFFGLVFYFLLSLIKRESSLFWLKDGRIVTRPQKMFDVPHKSPVMDKESIDNMSRINISLRTLIRAATNIWNPYSLHYYFTKWHKVIVVNLSFSKAAIQKAISSWLLLNYQCVCQYVNIPICWQRYAYIIIRIYISSSTHWTW